MLITFCSSTFLSLLSFNRGTECDCVRKSCGVKVYLTKQCGGSVIPTGGTVVLRYGCTGGLFWWWWVGGGVVGGGTCVLSGTPVVAGVYKVILSNFPCSGLGWGVPSYSPDRIPTKTQNILSGSPLNEHLEQQHFTIRIYFRPKNRHKKTSE